MEYINSRNSYCVWKGIMLLGFFICSLIYLINLAFWMHLPITYIPTFIIYNNILVVGRIVRIPVLKQFPATLTGKILNHWQARPGRLLTEHSHCVPVIASNIPTIQTKIQTTWRTCQLFTLTISNISSLNFFVIRTSYNQFVLKRRVSGTSLKPFPPIY